MQKLTPFFPPHEQLQSLNLRNALFRCLEQAKKNGALGRDVLLRKTMLDECKGDRVEEVLAVFSNVVLKKMLHTQGTSRHPALAQQLALENFSYHGERAAVASLVVVHKASLGKHLREKEENRARYNDFSSLLDLNDRRIARRHEQLKQLVEDNDFDAKISGSEVMAIQAQVQKNWSGKPQWLESILYGDSKAHGEGLLSTRFEKVWRHVEDGTIGDVEDRSGAGLLEQLDARVKTQEHRLARWQDFGRSISSAKSPNLAVEIKHPPTQGQKIDLGFDLHQELHIGRSDLKEPVQSNSSSMEEYTRLVENMNAELAQVGKPQAQIPPTPRRVISTVVLSPQSGFPQVEKRTIQDEGWSSASDSEEAFPASPNMIASTPANISTSGPHMLRRGRQNLADRSSTTPVQRFKFPERLSTVSPSKSVAKQVDLLSDPQTTPSQGSTPQETFQSSSPSKSVTKRATSSTLALALPDPQAFAYMNPSGTPSPEKDSNLHLDTGSMAPPPPPTASKDSESDLADAILDSMAAASPSPKKQRHTLSLAERTRLSMSRASYSQVSFDDEYDIPPSSRSPIKSPPLISPLATPEVEPGLHEDLMERTRKSMAGFEQAQKKAQLERRRSVKEEKKRVQRSSYFPQVEEERESLMPDISAIELMEGDPDYESVFKSRPKIATSPAISPMRSWDSTQ